MAGREITDVQGGSAESLDLHRLPRLEKPIGDTALIEHLDGARVQTAGACAVGIRGGASFHDDDIDLGQGQLSRQHHSGRASAGDHHRMFGHSPLLTSVARGSVVRAVDCPCKGSAVTTVHAVPVVPASAPERESLFIGFLVAAASNRSERNLEMTLARLGQQDEQIAGVEDRLGDSLAQNTTLTSNLKDGRF